MKAMGLDLSLTATGVSIWGPDGRILDEVITSKPLGKTPANEIQRLKNILEEVRFLIEEHQPDIVAIEGLAFMVRNSTALVQLAGLNYLIRHYLLQNEIPFLVVAPTTLKKYITGKGNAQKDHMMLEIYKVYDETYLDNNLADAFSLAMVGLATLGHPTQPLKAKQEEVLTLVKAQLN